jgi:hypothetical protein
MKYPKRPQQPIAPIKPNAPDKIISATTSLGSIKLDKYGSGYSLESFAELIKSETNVDLKDVHFTFEVEQTPTYYDQVITDLSIDVYAAHDMENPRYEELYRIYELTLIAYNKKLPKFEEENKKYKKDIKIFNLEMDKYTLEHSKLQVERLEKKLKK